MPSGYGQIGTGSKADRSNRRALTHRVAWEVTYGPIPDGAVICHTCDNPPCCNPGHLFIGTQVDNMRDASMKGRTRGGGWFRTPSHCIAGHPFSGDNLRVRVRNDGRSERICRTCNREHARRWRQTHR